MFNHDEELDKDLDEEEEDADNLDDENSEEEEDADDDADQDDSDDNSDEEDEEDDDNKPVTRKELREMLGKNRNKSNANRRISSKKGNFKNQSPKIDDRLSEIEKNQNRINFIEKKRQFGHENGLSPEQVDVVFRMTKRPTPKFLKQGFVKAALDAIQQESNLKSNTPSNSGKVFKGNGGKSWDKMDDHEKQSNFADRRKAILERKK